MEAEKQRVLATQIEESKAALKKALLAKDDEAQKALAAQAAAAAEAVSKAIDGEREKHANAMSASDERSERAN